MSGAPAFKPLLCVLNSSRRLGQI